MISSDSLKEKGWKEDKRGNLNMLEIDWITLLYEWKEKDDDVRYFIQDMVEQKEISQNEIEWSRAEYNEI